MKKLKIAMAQIETKLGDVQGNKEKIIDAIYKARESGAKILITPELSTLGFGSGDIYLDKVNENLEALEEIKQVAGEAGIIGVVGFVDQDERGFFYNAAAIIEDGEIIGKYHKVQLVNYRLFDEKRYFKPGSHLPVFKTKYANLGVLICEDVWFPEPSRGLTFRGAEILIVLSASPYDRGKNLLWKDFLRERVRDNILPAVFVNQSGIQDGVTYWGGSMAFSASGKLIKELPLLEETFGTVEIDLDESKRLRRRDIRVREVRREILEELLDAYEDMNL